MKVLFVNDSTTSSNWGDRAAAISLRAMIRQSGGRIIHTITEQDLWDSSFGPRTAALADASERSTRDRARDAARLWLPPILLETRRRVLSRGTGAGQDQHHLIPQSWEDFAPAAERVLREQRYGWPAVLRAIDDADVVVIHGASLHGGGFLPRTDLFLTYLAKTRFGTSVVITNHTADLEYVPLRRMAEHVYPLFDDVVYRDPISPVRWGSLCGGRFAADTAFRFEPARKDAWAPLAKRATYLDVWPDTASFDPSEPYVCVGGSSIFHERRDWSSVLNGYDGLIRYLQSAYSGAIVLTASADLDMPVFRALAERFDLPLVGVTTPVQQAVDILGSADAYIGGRWHPSIFALRGGTPLLALSSQTFKMRALAEITGSSETFDALDPGRHARAICKELAVVLEQGDELRSRLRGRAEDMAQSSWDNVAYLRELRARSEATADARA
jgi:polysaccharide pyruvyl transferase WcaK-like protein